MAAERVLAAYTGMYKSFDRKGGSAPTATHYCPGCGHGILHKLIGEALADLDIQDRSVLISPVGCAVFAYYYLDCGNVQAAHGRAAAVGTGITRAAKHAVVMSYQGDGDLCSIGLCETLHAANRGEKIAIFFVNNAVYGMTGGQMAPTTLLGQKTTTTPTGRAAAEAGFPMHACEMINVLAAPVYIERCSLAEPKRIRDTRRAVRKALEIQKAGKGFAFVEVLSPCPTNIHCSPLDAARFVTEKMEQEFPLGCLRDRSAEAPPIVRPESCFDKAALEKAFSDYGTSGVEPVPDPTLKQKNIRVAGFGGQGVLSLGLMLARAAQAARRYVTWLPSYGPEQRGGTANCCVVVSGRPIGSPLFAESDVLVAMNRPSLEHFAPQVLSSGLIFYDAAIGTYEAASGVRAVAVPALELANTAGAAQAANTAMFGVVAATGVTGLPLSSFPAALAETFSAKPKLIPINQKVFAAAAAWAQQTGLPCQGA